MSRRIPPYPLARLFAALADPTRLRLLNLMAGKEVCVCYFVEILNEGQPKISRHLAYLRKAGLVDSRRDGKWMHYSLHPPQDPAAHSILQTALSTLAGQKQMQADRARLTRACCQPQKLVSLQAAPLPRRT